MLFILLPQLAVSAKLLLCLLMVVIGGAMPSVVRPVNLFSESSKKYVQVNDAGQVYASDSTDADKYQNLSIISIDFTKLSIYSKQTERFICFNRRWKIVGMPISQAKSRNMTRCQFYEEINDYGYNTYRSVENESHYLAFNSRGKPVKRHPLKGYGKKCRYFMTQDPNFNILLHNKKKTHGNPPSSAYQYNHSVEPQTSRVHKMRHHKKNDNWRRKI